MPGTKTAVDFVDMHSHILPGLDDGSEDMEETLAMLKIAYASGIRNMIVTPHYKLGRHNAGMQTINNRISMVMEEAAKRGYSVSLYPGNEVYYYTGFEDDLEAGKFLTMNGTNRVLVEFNPSERYSYIRTALDNIRSIGYVPILAHVERYECMLGNPANVQELRVLGVEIQANASSVIGKVGGKVKKYLLGLLADGMIDYIGTDAHDKRKRIPEMKKCYKYLKHKLEPEYVDEIMHDNAYSLIDY